MFEKHGRAGIGLWLVKTSFSLSIKIEDTFTIFSLSGTIPVINNKLKRCFKALKMLLI